MPSRELRRRILFQANLNLMLRSFSLSLHFNLSSIIMAQTLFLIKNRFFYFIKKNFKVINMNQKVKSTKNVCIDPKKPDQKSPVLLKNPELNNWVQEAVITALRPMPVHRVWIFFQSHQWSTAHHLTKTSPSLSQFYYQKLLVL